MYLLYPAWLEHYAVPHACPNPRVSLAANFRLDRGPAEEGALEARWELRYQGVGPAGGATGDTRVLEEGTGTVPHLAWPG